MYSNNEFRGFCVRNLYMYLNTKLLEKNQNFTNYVLFKEKSKTYNSLQELLSLRKGYTQQDYISGRAQIPAYYTQSVLPGNTASYCGYINNILYQLKYIKLKMKTGNEVNKS